MTVSEIGFHPYLIYIIIEVFETGECHLIIIAEPCLIGDQQQIFQLDSIGIDGSKSA
ncbi:hypothetical protein D9M68_695080 [compost metagenome]